MAKKRKSQKEIEERQKELEQTRKDRKKMEELLSHFFIRFSEMEMDLANLFSISLKIPYETSHVARAVYYKLNSFDARAGIANAAVSQLIIENIKLNDLEKSCEYIFDKVRRIKDARNNIAHGSITTFVKNHKHYVRIAPPVDDVHRSHKKLMNLQMPGMSSHEVEVVTQQCIWVAQRLQDLEIILSDFHDELDTFPETLLELQKNLQEISYPS